MSLQSVLCSRGALGPAPLPTPKSGMEKVGARRLASGDALMGLLRLQITSFSLTASADQIKRMTFN